MSDICVILAGWADREGNVDLLIEELEKKFDKVLHFRYAYSKNPWEPERMIKMDILAQRFLTYLTENNLLEKPQKFDIVGFSQGGMLALYSMGLYEKIRNSVGKFCSVASPHGGAFIDIFQNMINATYNTVKNFLTTSSNPFSPLFSIFFEMTESYYDIFAITDKNSHFLRKKYPEACKKVFSVIPKERLLEIYSDSDIISPPESCRRFEGSMQLKKVHSDNHIKLANIQEVIDKILEFLN